MTSHDIVTRLRGFMLPNDTLSIVRDEAADEIERLRKALLAEENAYDILRLENERLRNELASVTNKLNLERDINLSKENTNG